MSQVITKPPAASDTGSDLAAEIARTGLLPLAWVRPTEAAPFPNLGDALSPIIVGTLSGLPIEARDFDDRETRLVAVGTIAQSQRRGSAHFWGCGLDAANFAFPDQTRFTVHAMRGPRSAAVLRGHGIPVPEIYGDPVWFLPRMLKRQPAPQTELGVVVHISELQDVHPGSPLLADYVRYAVPTGLANTIRVINTFCKNDFASLFGKVDEILACRRIISTSFHGLLIAEAYGIPCVWFGPQPGGAMSIDPRAPAIEVDHRFLDFFAGTRAKRMRIFCQPRDQATPWEQVIRWIDRAWQPLDHDPTPLFNAFPLPPVVSLKDDLWRVDVRSLATMIA